MATVDKREGNAHPKKKVSLVGSRKTMVAATRRPGLLKGRTRIGRNLDAPLPSDVARAFRGESD